MRMDAPCPECRGTTMHKLSCSKIKNRLTIPVTFENGATTDVEQES